MNNFLPIKRNHRAAPLRLAARIISIMILAFLWPVGGGAQTQTTDLDVSDSKITAKLALTYKQKSDSQNYAWYYKVGEGDETEFSGTLTGTNENWQHGAINIKSEKAIADADHNLDSYPILKLDGLNLTYNANDSLFYMVQNGGPLCIQATGSSASTLKCQGVVISNVKGCDLLLDGGAAGLNILGKGNSNGIYLYTTGHSVDAILKGKINIVADDEYAVSIGNSASLSAVEDAKITVSAGSKAILNNNVKSPFLRWEFEAAPESGKTLEIKDANGKSFSPAIQFKTDGNNKSFAINVKKDTGYTLWLDDDIFMINDKTTVFTATDNKLFIFEGMQFPTDWPTYGQTAHVGTNGTDVSVSGTNYTVKTPRGLAWIAWVTNNGNIANTTTNITNTGDAYYPANAGFKDCTVTLAKDISLATPTEGVATDFTNNWIPIGTYSYNSSSDYTKCFQGTFDGNGKTITGMTISSISVNYVGLFGYLYGATVKDLTMADEGNTQTINWESIPNSSGDDNYYLGSVAGYMVNGKIINCHNKCAVSFSVSGKGGNVGGIAGIIDKNSVLSACSNSGAITVDGSTVMGGGIVGVSAKSSIVSCFNTGDVSATGTTYTAYAGGIVGDGDTNGDSNNPSQISHCYSTGNITAKASGISTSGGIVGGARYAVIESCFAMGTVSAEPSGSNAVYAGGIIGWIWSSSKVTVKDCLALNTDGVKATGNTSGKQAGRIVGKNSGTNNDIVTLSNNYASTKIQLTAGDQPSVPTIDIAADAINGADVYLDEVADVIADWTGEGKAFTAIDTTENGKLPRLKVITAYNTNGLLTAYEEGSFIPGQPDNLTSSTYLPFPDPLSLSSDGTDLTLSCSNGKWSYKKGRDIALTRFNGTVKMAEGASSSTNKLVISTVTGNPTLTFEKVDIKPTGGAALTINADCALTINIADEGTSTLSSSGASTLVNKGILTLTGKGLYIGNTGTIDTHYGLDNSGTFTVTDPSSTSVTFHCAGTAIHNTGTGKLGNAWMEWQFAEAPGDDGKIAFAATDDDNQSPAAQLRQGKTFATTVTAGKTYRLWTVTNNGDEARTRQQGKTSAVPAVPVVYFQAPSENGVAVFTDVKDAVLVTVTQPTAGGSISVFCNDSLLAKADTLPNGVKLTLKSYPLPGYELNAFVITPEVSNASNPTSEYTIPDDATTVTITASFKAKTVAPADTTQADIVDNVETLPETPVEKPTAVIAKGNTTASNNADSEVKLITGALEPEHKGSVKDTLGKIAANISESNIIFAEIALVEITTTSGSGGAQMTTMTPIQPKDGHTVHVVYPYPSGTNNNDSFVIVHLKTDGTMEVYRDVPDTSKGEMKLDKTARGLEFDVDSFSPFGIAWTKAADPTPDPNPVPDPTPVYYTVTLPALEGATTDPVAGDYEVESWSSFRFYLTLDKDYDQSVPVVTTSRGETIEPRTSDGAYIIKYVRTPVAISIAGIQKNTDVANETIEAGVKVWTEPSALCLETDRTEEVRIVTVSGSTVAVFEAKPGLNRRALAPGLYIIQTPRKVCKVIVR